MGMTHPLHPVPRTDLPRPRGARPLAGSAHVWWDAADLAQADLQGTMEQAQTDLNGAVQALEALDTPESRAALSIA